VCGRAAGNTPRTQKQTEWSESRNCTNSVLALQDHCSYKAPTTNHHIKQKNIQNAKRDGRDISLCLLEWRNVPTQGLDSSALLAPALCVSRFCYCGARFHFTRSLVFLFFLQ